MHSSRLGHLSGPGDWGPEKAASARGELSFPRGPRERREPEKDGAFASTVVRTRVPPPARLGGAPPGADGWFGSPRAGPKVLEHLGDCGPNRGHVLKLTSSGEVRFRGLLPACLSTRHSLGPPRGLPYEHDVSTAVCLAVTPRAGASSASFLSVFPRPRRRTHGRRPPRV